MKIRKINNGLATPTVERVSEPAIRAHAPVEAGMTKSQFPCSPGQRRFWLLHQLNPRDSSLNVTARWRLEGSISNGELEKTFRLIMQRHQILRTFFAESDTGAMQIVEPHVSFHIPIVDLTELPDAQAQIETERIAGLDVSTPFDLSAPPLIRVTHVRLCKNASVLLVTLHHIVSDAWSMDILAREISDIYVSLHAARLPVLQDLPVSYGEFAVWKEKQLSSPIHRLDIEFWKQSLKGLKHFEMQTDHPRPPLRTTDAGTLWRVLDRDLTNQLAYLGHHNGATLHATFLAALLVLLHRYTGEIDISIGGQSTGRDEISHGNMIGLFRNILVMRNDLSGDPSFIKLLKRIHSNHIEMMKHQLITHEDLIGIVNPKPDLSRNPLFSVSYRFQRADIKNDTYSAFKLIDLPAISSDMTCDLNFCMEESPEGWRVRCEYNLGLFEGRTISRFLHHFDILLRTVVLDPARKISNLTIIDDSERRELVVENNCTSVIYPKHLTLPQLFEDQVMRSPDAIAVVCGETGMSYRDLDIASNRMAHQLRKSGVKPGSRVAIVLDRSPELMVALLAVLKAGGAYIPLDPVYPTERLQYILANSRPTVIITRESLRERVAYEAMSVLVVDSRFLVTEEQSEEPLPTAASPADTAYIIYTSGSTGRPKGVAIHHRALVNLLYAMQRQPGLGNDDTLVSVTTISFDMAVPDLFLPLIVGAKLVLAKDSEMADGNALLMLLRRHRATFMQATPVMWQVLIEAGWHGDPPLKMLCGGEAMPRKLADKLLDCGGELWNMYGPTETTVWSSALRVASSEGPVLIGPPIANTQFYILDSHQELVPRGVPGELFIGGDGVALGYFDQLEVTKEKFIDDKFRKSDGARLYRTGDMVRLKQHGSMEYLGRIDDDQVKLRGFRIELGEIEFVVLQHPDIVEAIAVLGQDPSGEGAIWAYVVPKHTVSCDAEVLTGMLYASIAQSLPAYMRPASIVILDTLPRTPNGKIDRHSLPAPVPAARQMQETVQPLNEVERRVAKIWSSVLGREITIKDADFFELGGHSLLAARLLARIEAEFGQRLSLLALFNAPSIGEQAKLLMPSSQREYDFRQVVRLHPNGSKSPLIAIHNTGVYYYSLSKLLGPDQPLMALQLFDPSVDNHDLPRSLSGIAAKYVQLIQKFQPTGPYKLIGWCVGGVLAFEVARQLVAAGNEVSLLAMIDAWAPGHTRRMSWLRASLADFSYRWQLIGADFQKVLSRKQNLTKFVSQRVVSKRLVRWFGGSRGDAEVSVAHGTELHGAENYDKWLLKYLEEAAQDYQPRLYSGKILLLSSAQEPKGIFLDPKMGWGDFALAGVDLAVIDGDHFTMFKGQGLAQMATHISAV